MCYGHTACCAHVSRLLAMLLVGGRWGIQEVEIGIVHAFLQ